jgi:hypothetical protein
MNINSVPLTTTALCMITLKYHKLLQIVGETEILRENLPQRHFVHHKSHLTKPGIEPRLPRWEASD